MEYFAGLDVSLRSCALCIVDAKGNVILERELPCDVMDIAQCLTRFAHPIERVGFEAGTMSQHLFFGLTGEGFDVVCMEARQVNAALCAMRNKTDRNDARGIAQVLRTGWFSPVHMKSREAHGVRALLSTRKALLSKTIDLANEVRGLLKIFGIRLPKTVKHGSFDGIVRPMIEMDDVLAHALLPLLDARLVLYHHFLEHAAAIPDHDVLVAGFPCQPFSIAGVSKKNALGRLHGFDDETQGTLFFDILRILMHHRPAGFLLENVKNLKSHDKGRTFDVIRRKLEDELGYQLQTRIIDAAHYLPQHRERIVMVGFRENVPFSFDDIHLPSRGTWVMRDILHPENGFEEPEGHYTLGPDSAVNKKYTLTNKLWQYLQDYAAKHKAKGNGFGFGLVGSDSIARTLSARYYKDGSEILVNQGEGRNPRRLTPRECARLMGYDEGFRIPVSDTQSYKQFGNSVAVPVFADVARAMRPHILSLIEKQVEPAHRVG
jgi:DNA (cytosine-5)-methyltransferase 1